LAGNRQAWSDERVEEILSLLLRAGVILASSLVLIGGIIFLFRHGGELPDYRTFRGQPVELRHLPKIYDYARALHGRGIIQIGLLLLVATPIVRVIFSVFAFARQHDRIYVGITLIVLGVLMFSLIGNH